MDLQESSRIAKDKVTAIKKQQNSRLQAKKVYEKHGSRNNRNRINASSVAKKRRKIETKDAGQPNILLALGVSSTTTNQKSTEISCCNDKKDNHQKVDGWECPKCTFFNTKIHAPVCQLCQSIRIQ